MRASTLFALTAAILIGLGVAVWGKMFGYFGPREQPLVRKPDPNILVAAKNIFAGDALDSTAVRVRPLNPEEVKAYRDNPQNYLPALPQAAMLRVAAKNIETDTPITKDLLKEMAKPTALNERLLPDMRAVNLVLSKDRSAGGLIQVGEWVDVYLTSNIDGDGIRTTRTAVIAPNVRVIAKRDNLWQIYAPLPKDKPVEYTLEVNAYRAAMIEFSRTKGILSMAPLPHAEQKKLEANRQDRMVANPKGESVLMAMAEDPETSEEAMRIQEVEKGAAIISDSDLAKLFGLDLTPAGGPEPPLATTKVERFVGTRRVSSSQFTLDGKPYFPGPLGDGSGRSDSPGAYPPAPYSPNVDLHSGRMIPNSALYTGGRGFVGTLGTWGRDRNVNFGPPRYNFSQPSCPTCPKPK